MLLTSPVMYSPHMREMRSLVLKAKLHCFLCTQILFCYCVPRSRIKCWLWWRKIELEMLRHWRTVIGIRHERFSLTRIFLHSTHYVFALTRSPPPLPLERFDLKWVKKIFFHRHKISAVRICGWISCRRLFLWNGLCISGIKHCIGVTV